MNIVISEKTNDKNIFHPVLLVDLRNQPNKKLTLPQGTDDYISEQIFFTDEDIEQNLDHEGIFYSHDYFFKAIFTTVTFEDHITSILNLMDQDSHFNTIAYLIERFEQTKFNHKDINIDKLIQLYSSYDKKYKNEEKTYAFYYDVVKKIYFRKI